jgi:hypothetical protein
LSKAPFVKDTTPVGGLEFDRSIGLHADGLDQLAVLREFAID